LIPARDIYVTVCGIYTTHYVVASGVSPEATQPMVDALTAYILD